MPNSVTFMFPGQGSQYYGMAKEFFDKSGVFSRCMRSLDEAFADHGLPGVLREIYREDRAADKPFNHLEYTHPSLFMVELSVVEMLRDEGIRPDYVIGASLGEFAAATVSGVAAVEDVVRAIVAQVEVVREHCPPGAMLAVLDDFAQYRAEGSDLEVDAARIGGLELAALNYDRHFVLAGDSSDVARQESRLRAEGTIC